ncbi:two-component system, repressor protein LuxO [Thalassospira xiamenensis M-5 = DSM 17429]|uniref:Regulatory protein LuxO n=1 Tax=Thalassospira xiamenensis M-5 = DSM 17429 TaxID=1123366 RepID=A0AB72UAF1_9PROT|nr:sigma-54 dependent transcriptional regulator [Thalassospira xiamenensis]AJD51193.1 regulatory protein LuxO [Thalassospira xiamenensis M-5 = DSM 17429]SIT16403.1 two-component system, repressor protein LuxO [Thalassospira xiamenensis M-5 = DSM 17429]
MPEQARIIVVEDTLSLARVYQDYLRADGHKVEHVVTGRDAIQRLRNDPPDVLVLDLILPDMDGRDVLRAAHQAAPECKVVVITAHGSVNVAVEAMRDGAWDFLLKPFTADKLRITVSDALEGRSAISHAVQKSDGVDTVDEMYFDIIGASDTMHDIYRIIENAAPSRATVFITGESGTGKELAAEAIHRRSERVNEPFIPLNCGAIPKDLMESEIFGHVKGAFTGAVIDREGAAHRADGGTLFLDEICEMDLDLQTKLLRFIQTGTFQKVGGSSIESVDVRFVCATNRDPLEEVRAGRFREDLYYRLHVIPLHMPPLRDRDDDILQIANFYLQRFTREEGRDFQRFSPDVAALFARYAWPGNIRQLQNIIRNIVVLNNGTEVTMSMVPRPVNSGTDDERFGSESIEAPPPHPVVSNGLEDAGRFWEGDPDALAFLAGARNLRDGVEPKHMDMAPVMIGANGRFGMAPMPTGLPIDSSYAGIKPLWLVEKQAIEEAIVRCGGSIPRAADALGVSPSTIYRKKQAWEENGAK